MSRAHHPFSIVHLAVLFVLVLGALTAASALASHPADVIYVDDSATGADNGSSWADAYESLQDGLAHANSGDEIWVAAGTYTPGASRSDTFRLKNGVEVYGGFAGGETQREQRDWEANRTVLSGDIDANDSADASGVVTDTANIVGANSYHVVTGSGTDASALLDGFTVTAGQANGSTPDVRGGGMYISSGGPTLAHLTFSGNLASSTGGAAYNNGSNPALTNVIFSGNSAGNRGGGMYNTNSSSPMLADVTFSGNSALDGGGMYNSDDSSPTLAGALFSGNEATEGGGGMYNSLNSNPSLTNASFSGNSAISGAGMYSRYNSSATLDNVSFQGNSAVGSGSGMLNETGSSPTLTNVTFSGNTGRAMFNSDNGDVTLVNVTFSSNTGGGMSNYNSDPTLVDVTFIGNSANAGAGMNNGEGSSATLVNVSFSGNSADCCGGGMYNGHASSILVNVTFSGNSTSYSGGGMYNNESSPALANVTFSGNTASESGGGMYSWGSTSRPKLVNVTFSGNSASAGGGIYAEASSPSIQNSIVWGNAGGDISEGTIAPTVEYSLVGGTGVYTGTGNLNADPRFVDADGPDNDPGTADDDLRLRPDSPAVDAGKNSLVPTDTLDIDEDSDTNERLPLDLEGEPRFVDIPSKADTGDGTAPIVDMGAFEADPDDVIATPTASATGTSTPMPTASSTAAATHTATATATGTAASATPTATATAVGTAIIYVDDSAMGANDGSSWADAYRSLQDGLGHANSGDEIWVAAGIYRPGSAVSDTFQLENGVEIYGGFAGGETQREQRDWETNRTVLSGDIDANDSADASGVVTETANIVGANSYHVVTGSGTDASAVLDGFAVTAGQAYGYEADDRGAGMYAIDGSPTLANVTFSGNTATIGGGMYNYESSPTLTNVTFSGNSAEQGGGMFNDFDSSPTLTDVTFSDNSAFEDGAGMANYGSSPRLRNVTFSGNLAYQAGGMANWNSSPTLTNVIFAGNSADREGGGMFNMEGSSPALANVTFSGNSAQDGGGMNNTDSSPTLTNVTFSGNSAEIGGGIINSYESYPQLRNSIVWGNLGGNILNYEGAAVVEYSLVGGRGVYPGAGNINADPRFVDADGPDNDPGTLDDDLRLRLDSPAIDAGKNSYVPADTLDIDKDSNTAEQLPLDLDGEPRFVDIPSRPDTGDGTAPIVDMGAYEADPGDATATPTASATGTSTPMPTASSTAEVTHSPTATGTRTATGTAAASATTTATTTVTATTTPTRMGHQLYLPLVHR